MNFAWQSPWGNLGGYVATACRTVDGELELQIAATGGELTPGGLMFTLPSGFAAPIADYRGFFISGSTGQSVGVFQVNTDRTVTFIGIVTGPGYAATSTTSLAIGTGTKTFTTQAGLAYSAGARARASSAANTANYMEGLVTSYSGTTLVISVDTVGGSGTHADWNLNLAGNVGSAGSAGATGATGANGSNGADGGIKYTYSTNTVSSDPGTGTLKFDSATLSAITSLRISETDANSNSIAALIQTLDDSTSSVKATVLIVKDGAPGNMLEFQITGTFTDNGTWDSCTITYIGSSGSFSNGDSVRLFFSLKGDKGDTGATGPGGGTGILGFSLLQNQQAAGTSGGTTTPTTWTVCPLNTKAIDAAGNVSSLTSNTFVLAAGTYIIAARQPVVIGQHGKIRLRNTTDNATVVVGGNIYANAGGGGGDGFQMLLRGQFTIAASKNLQLQYYVNSGQATNGLGQAESSGEIEIYGEVELTRTA